MVSCPRKLCPKTLYTISGAGNSDSEPSQMSLPSICYQSLHESKPYQAPISSHNLQEMASSQRHASSESNKTIKTEKPLGLHIYQKVSLGEIEQRGWIYVHTLSQMVQRKQRRHRGRNALTAEQRKPVLWPHLWLEGSVNMGHQHCNNSSPPGLRYGRLAL